jgi:Pyruvate/2-oxoacid:ferredoxin oxidoreductase delta subunit
MSFDSDSPSEAQSSQPDLDGFETQGGSGRLNPTPVPIRIDYDLCERTGACVTVCPEDVIEDVGGQPTITRAEACTECWICVENCTSGAIEVG